VRFVAFRFTPAASRFKGQACGGVQVILTDRNAFDPAIAGLEIARTLEASFPDAFDAEKVDNLLFNAELVEDATRGGGLTRAKPPWAHELAAFMTLRGKYLLYK
jgi:uncharacterized protein YbbC (DUF1343 family)